MADRELFPRQTASLVPIDNRLPPYDFSDIQHIFIRDTMNLTSAIERFDRAGYATHIAEAHEQRTFVQKAFPLDDWPTLPLERYALGMNGESFCRTLEYGTPALGSISGGSAAKHIMFRHRTGEWRLATSLAGMSVDEAWQHLRKQFVTAFEIAQRGDFAELDDLDVLLSGPALVTKSLATYFPQHFLPIYSAAHLRHYIEVLRGVPEPNVPAWQANRQLGELVSSRDEFVGWSPDEVARLLYEFFDPRARKRRILKVAPGNDARLWPDCLANSHICVGWDEIGDLTEYTSDTELRDVMDATYPERTGANLSKARNLISFRDLEAGDLVVANRGIGHVLAVGTVTGGYRFDDDRAEYKHLVPVEWDTTYERDLPANMPGWRQTFAKVTEKFLAELEPTSNSSQPVAFNRALPQDIARVLGELERKRQVILHGPPGTGKTRLALRTALAMTGRSGSIDARDERDAIKAVLGTDMVQLVTFHPSYGYEDFIEGFKPDRNPSTDGLRLTLTDGLFRALCATAEASADETFLLIIDEINRGDLPRIFGETITLLESDKRGLELTLPISGRKFAVPANVRIIGTMNTADRSVSHLDAAIRRRFAFVPVDPDPDALSGAVGPLDLGQFLSALNARIGRILDADHHIGHAYLLRGGEPVATEEELAAAFYSDIVPLLEDYCIGRVELLREILGRLADKDTARPAQIAVADLPGELAAEYISTVSGAET
ncbi:McrB family protein [Nocardia rhamnosiphila]|uniref:McrB family protein n=1 Tax=Nocardia rhamnosiphila TaxID=426716 RepID=UPI000AC8FDE7|nr:AAA family ATPase [Nocardia rhamnosiphila]